LRNFYRILGLRAPSCLSAILIIVVQGALMKILVVDDSKTNLMMTAAYLEKMGHKPLTTTDPFECAKLFESEKPDLVILDVMMEGMDGYECAKEIRKMNDADDDWVPIIFLSAMIDDKSIAKGIDAGGDDYLTKPYSEITLEAKIKAMQRIANMRDKLFEANTKLNQISLTDGLTGIPNRRAFDEKLQSEWQRACRLSGKQGMVSVVMIDIDHFKAYNDEFGHQMGDDCLKKIAKALATGLKREAEQIYRYGGEEFVAVLPHLNEEEAKKIADKFRKIVETLKIEHAKNTGQSYVTISCGLASEKAEQKQKPQAIVEHADAALYQAKEKGRNCVQTYKSK